MKKICLCASFKFYDNVLKFADVFKSNGIEIMIPIPNQFLKFTGTQDQNPNNEMDKSRGEKIVAAYWKHITDHLGRIESADIVYIYTENGYIGNGVSLEIGYAHALKKIIYSSEEIHDLPISCFIHKIIRPEELIAIAKP
jgi:nucleoside 2-deoxyribosyltransferase